MDKKKPPAKKAAEKKPAPKSRVSPASVPRDNHGTKKTAGKKPAAKAKPAQSKRVPIRKAAGKAPPPALADTDDEHQPQLALTERQQRFVDEYLVDLNGTQAAIRAGYSMDTARVQASQLLSKLNVQAAITEGRRRQQERTGISADKILKQAWDIATADPRELMELKVGCCRYCWGIGHRQQRTLAEMNRALEAFHANKKKPRDAEFDEEGGIGFDANRPPHPECPECYGDGQPREVLHDTRLLSPAAAQLYAGVKRTKEGLQMLTKNQEAYAEKIWKHLGLYEKDNQQKADPFTSMLNRIAQANGNGFQPVQIDPRNPPKADDGDSEP